MPTIGQLNQVSGLQPSDIFPLFIGMSQSTRRATLAQLLEFMQDSLILPSPDLAIQYAAPSTDAFVVPITQPTTGNTDVHLILTPASAFASGTIQLPPKDGLKDGQIVRVNTTQAITALTFDLNGASTITGGPTTLQANNTFTLAYSMPASNWYMLERSVPNPATVDTIQTLLNKTFVAPALGTPISGDLANCLNLPIGSGVSGLGAGVSTFLSLGTAAALLALMTPNATGSGSLVFNSSPLFIGPRLGTPFSGILTNCTGLPISTGVAGLAAGVAAFLSAPTSATLLALLADATGTGANVFNNGPTLIAPRLGTPFSGDLSNCINLPISTGVSGLAALVAAFLAAPSSANLLAAMTDKTGTGLCVFANGPTLSAPVLNAPSFGAPGTKTAAFTLGATENMVICNGTASIPVTLPAASSAPGRAVRIKNIAAFTVTSATANVVPLAGGAAGTAILPATAGASALLVSDGANWIIMA